MLVQLRSSCNSLHCVLLLPSIVDHSQGNDIDNLNLAFEVAEKHLDIPKMLDAEGNDDGDITCMCNLKFMYTVPDTLAKSAINLLLSPSILVTQYSPLFHLQPSFVTTCS